MSVKQVMTGIGFSEKEAIEISKQTKKLRKDLAKFYGCSLKEAQERYLQIPDKL